MNKLVLVSVGCAAMAAVGRTLVVKSAEVEGSDNVQTQNVSQVQGVNGEAWAELALVKVYVPANETGVVTVTAWQLGGWTNLVTAACTNNTEAAVVLDFSGGDAVFYGSMRVLYDQEGSATNGWGAVLIIQ